MDVIGGNDVPGAVLDLINHAREQLILVSAYFDPWEKLTAAIQDAVLVRKVPTMLLLRGGDEREKHEQRALSLLRTGAQAKYLSGSTPSSTSVSPRRSQAP